MCPISIASIVSFSCDLSSYSLLTRLIQTANFFLCSRPWSNPVRMQLTTSKWLYAHCPRQHICLAPLSSILLLFFIVNMRSTYSHLTFWESYFSVVSICFLIPLGFCGLLLVLCFIFYSTIPSLNSIFLYHMNLTVFSLSFNWKYNSPFIKGIISKLGSKWNENNCWLRGRVL